MASDQLQQQHDAQGQGQGSSGFDIDLGNFDLSDFMQSSAADGLFAAGNGNADGGSMDIQYQNMHMQQQHLVYADHQKPQSANRSPSGSMSMFPRAGQSAVTAESLKLQLQQQMKLQQLQQLQNHILQQQVRLRASRFRPSSHRYLSRRSSSLVGRINLKGSCSCMDC